MSADQATIECAGCRKPTPIIEDGVDHICPECEILALKRKLAEQQALLKIYFDALSKYEEPYCNLASDTLAKTNGGFELNNLLAKAKEEGRKEALESLKPEDARIADLERKLAEQQAWLQARGFLWQFLQQKDESTELNNIITKAKERLERKLAEQQAIWDRLWALVQMCGEIVHFLAKRKELFERLMEIGIWIESHKVSEEIYKLSNRTDCTEELNNLLSKAKEEGRKEILSKVTENSILIRNDKGDVGLIYLSDFRLAVQTDVMREVRNGLLGLHNEVFELLDNISERQLSKAKKSAAPKPQEETK